MLTNESGYSIISLSARDRMAAGVATLLLDVFMLFGVAFAQPEILHNAAHDTRRAITVPCH